MIRKLIVPLVVSLFFFALTLAASGVFAERGAVILINTPCFLITVVAPFLLVSIPFGIKKTRYAFSAAFVADSDAASLKNAQAYFKNLIRYIVAFSVFSFSLGIIMILVYLAGTDSARIGNNIAVALLSVFYGSVAPIFLALPFLTAVDDRLSALG